MKAKTLFAATATVLAIAASSAFFYINQRPKILDYTSSDFIESTDIVQNPCQGFYNLYGFTLSDSDSTQALSLSKSLSSSDTNSLALVHINLKKFQNKDLSTEALSQLETILSSCESSRKYLILRFLYDWDGNATATEPDNISQILTHIAQIAPYVNNHKEIIYMIQGSFTGNYGEMHGSDYTDSSDISVLLEHMNKWIDPDIFLAVRTPAQWRNITGRDSSLSFEESFTGSLPSRLSLFNDGMLGSDTDLGTYGTSPISDQDQLDGKRPREEELRFQNTLCSFVPNGGECVSDNCWNDLESAVSHLSDMHVSYLNSAYDETVLNKWRNSSYHGEDLFYGINGYDYIASHLGFRYVVTDSFLNYESSGNPFTTLSVSLKNEGFSSSYRPFQTYLNLVSDSKKDTEISSFDIVFDARTFLSKEDTVLSADINPDELKRGTYSVYLAMEDNCGTKIHFANENEFSEKYGLLLGTLTIK